MSALVKIDLVSDVSCPWCVIGLKSLQAALGRLGEQVDADLHFQPFELKPQMPSEGEDLMEHISSKYGSSEEQVRRNREAISTRGAQLGLNFDMTKPARIYNPFNAHRLLHWA